MDRRLACPEIEMLLDTQNSWGIRTLCVLGVLLSLPIVWVWLFAPLLIVVSVAAVPALVLFLMGLVKPSFVGESPKVRRFLNACLVGFGALLILLVLLRYGILGH